MIKAKDRSVINNSGLDSSNKISEYFPNFYSSNKERVDSGKIKFIEEPHYIEGGVLIDLETLEAVFVDFRS